MSTMFGINTLGELEILSAYLEHTNQALTEVVKERESELQKSIDCLQIDGVSNDDLITNLMMIDTDFVDLTPLEYKVLSCVDGVDQAHEIAPLFYSSFIVLWFSFIERRLFALCKGLDLKMEIKIDSCENLGKGIERARRFLLKTKDYQIDSLHWGELIKIRELRNILVHNGPLLPMDDELLIREGTIPSDPNIDKGLLDYLRKYGLLLLSGDPFIKPQLDYCEHLMEFGKNLLEKLGKDLCGWNE